MSISQHVFPENWKRSKIIPLHKKKEDFTDPKNYRPVSLLPIFSKILERAVFVQIVKYMEENHLLHPSHHGFRQKHNTCTALLEMQDVWLDALDNKEVSAVIMLDLSAAFDFVDTKILLDKLELYGFNSCSLEWVSSYLTNRFQQVYVDGSLSQALPVEVGVPQGSILGPLLYVIFTNDLPEVVHQQDPPHDLPQTAEIQFYKDCSSSGRVCCFADAFSISNSDPEALKNNIRVKYQNISEYMALNKLFLNSDKTHLLIMASKKKHKKLGNFGITLDTGREIIEPVDCERLLGAQVSNDFTWNDHVRNNDKSMFKILTSRVNALRKISFALSFKSRKMIAMGIVMSRLIYLIQLFGGASGYLIDALQVIQNKTARIVTRLPWGTSTRTLLNQLGWLSIRQLVVFHDLVLVYKTKKDKKPVYLYEIFSKQFGYKTRAATANKIVQSLKPESEEKKKSFVYRSLMEWNLLPSEIKNIEKLDKFKIEAKKWIKTNIEV